jgi:hypothetical protein
MTKPSQGEGLVSDNARLKAAVDGVTGDNADLKAAIDATPDTPLEERFARRACELIRGPEAEPDKPLFMSFADWETLVEDLIEQEKQICATKGIEYTDGARTDNKLENFRVVADIVGITPMQVAMVYILKHLIALATIAREGQPRSQESVMSRCLDTRVYAALMAAIALVEGVDNGRGNGREN